METEPKVETVARKRYNLGETTPAVFSQNATKQLADVAEREAELFEQIGRLKMELEWLKKKADLLD